ncbi:Beta-defensin 108B [Galemys pyrenaicus]|uniref:Beta-defensin n=1 Tax=Galemys pyrenaicus TaxID=202257 RepID=A0A8J5ZWH7_GALPY|nr:Beta-defensin 108B [Galemys pyrenaicus]
MRRAVLLAALLSLLSRAPPARASFKEACKRPNGACQEFCTESEVQAGRCLNGQLCCLSVENQPATDNTPPP